MKALIYGDAERAVVGAAQQITNFVNIKPGSVLGVATGGTMLPVYGQLVALYQVGQVSFRETVTFNLDEYMGVSPSHPGSYHTYMHQTLFDHVDIDQSNTHLPRGDCQDPNIETMEYESLIARSGGIDLQIVGIGRNGHIGLNEPTSSLCSLTRTKTLAEDTRRANACYFDREVDFPKYAITMGVGSILASRKCLMLATGTSKARAVAAIIEGPVAAACPASTLQLHRRATIILDAEDASELRLTDSYQHVHPKGAESAWNK